MRPTSSPPGPLEAALYTGEGHPLGAVPAPSLDGPDGLIQTRLVCRVLFDLDNDAARMRDDVDLICILPIGSGPHVIAPDDLGAMIAVLDRGGRIAVHGSHVASVEQAIETVLVLSGGGRA